MNRNLLSVAQFAAATPFSQDQLRWWIFHAATNGLNRVGAVVRVGRRVYLDADRFDDWLRLQNPGLPPPGNGVGQ